MMGMMNFRFGLLAGAHLAALAARRAAVVAFVVAFVVVCVAVPSARAEGVSAEAAQAPAPAPAPVANLDLSVRAEGGAVAEFLGAQDLYALALLRHDAIAALAAARMAAQLVVHPVPRQPEGEAPDSGPQEAADQPSLPPDAAAMFDAARDMAGDDGLLALIEAERAGFAAPGTRRVGLTQGRLAPGQSSVWPVNVFAGDLAELAVLGDGSGVLDIAVQDAGLQLICRQSGPRDRLYCPFVPASNAAFRVVVTNPGPRPITYWLLAN